MPMGQLAARLAELDKSRPVYVICASGNRSAAMTDLLIAAGFDAYSVAGGTAAWARSGAPSRPAPRPAADPTPAPPRERHSRRPTMSQHTDLTIIPIETPSLGDRSYVVHDGEVAFVVDPQRDIDRVLALLEEHGVRLTDVFETHIHNDYVTGGLALAQRTGAAYHVNAEDEVSFERTPIRDGDTVEVGGRMRVTALATPGHTFTHLSYALTDAGEPASTARSASSPAGRCCTAPPAAPTCSARSTPTPWSATSTPPRTSWPTLLPDEAEVFPTHGFGSFCSATQSDATESTIGQEKQSNPVLTQDEETYVRELLDGLGAYPAYYAHMAPGQRRRPVRARPLDPRGRRRRPSCARRIEAGEWVVDLRNRTAFAAGHAPGTLNFGLDGAFATYLGWLITWGTPVTLLGETAEDVAEAQRELVRIGIDRPAAQATGGPEDWADRGARELPDRAPSPTSRRSATTARSSSSTCAAPTSTTRPRIEGAVEHPAPRAAGTALDEVPGRRGVGALRRRLPRLGRRVDARRRRPHAGRHRRHLRERREGRAAPGRPRGVTHPRSPSSPAR